MISKHHHSKTQATWRVYGGSPSLNKIYEKEKGWDLYINPEPNFYSTKNSVHIPNNLIFCSTFLGPAIALASKLRTCARIVHLYFLINFDKNVLNSTILSLHSTARIAESSLLRICFCITLPVLDLDTWQWRNIVW